MVRRCGILKIAPREDDPMCLLRLAEEDVAGELVNGEPVLPGLYHASRDALEKFGPRMLTRLKAAGVVPEGATLATMDTRLLT
jgi:hypothetical protein